MCVVGSCPWYASAMDDSKEDLTEIALTGATLLGVAATFAWLFWPGDKPGAGKSAAGPEVGPKVGTKARGDVKTIDFSKAQLHFVNDFEDSTFLGLSFPGLCGGMSFTALDYWNAKRSPDPTTVTPSTENDRLGSYIHDRQEDSLITHDENGIRFITLLADPSDDVLADTTLDEFASLKASIDKGTPVPLGLIPSPWTLDATNAHQVVGIGYEDASTTGGDRVVHIWDPNDPTARDTTLRQPAGEQHWFESSAGVAGDEWRGFFVEDYSPGSPP